MVVVDEPNENGDAAEVVAVVGPNENDYILEN